MGTERSLMGSNLISKKAGEQPVISFFLRSQLRYEEWIEARPTFRFPISLASSFSQLHVSVFSVTETIVSFLLIKQCPFSPKYHDLDVIFHLMGFFSVATETASIYVHFFTRIFWHESNETLYSSAKSQMFKWWSEGIRPGQLDHHQSKWLGILNGDGVFNKSLDRCPKLFYSAPYVTLKDYGKARFTNGKNDTQSKLLRGERVHETQWAQLR